MRIITRFPLLLSVLLLGCNAINQTRPEGGPDQVRPDQAAPTQPPGDNRTPPQNVAPPAAEQPRPEPPPPGNQTRFDQIEGRLTLIQEQLLQLRNGQFSTVNTRGLWLSESFAPQDGWVVHEERIRWKDWWAARSVNVVR